jgi:6-phosphogluconolactonase
VHVDGTHRLLCVGAYTAGAGGRGEGIRTFRQDTRTGELFAADSFAAPAPSFLAWHPMLRVVYAAHELPDGAVTGYRVDGDGGLAEMGGLSTAGSLPCHVAVSADGRHLVTANYGGGSVSVFELDSGGELTGRTDVVEFRGSGPDTEHQDASHVHQVILGTDVNSLVAVDLGADQIHTFRLDTAGRLHETGVCALPAGSGPRELVRDGREDAVFVVAELESALLRLGGPAGGGTSLLESISLAAVPGAPRNYPAHAAISDDERFLYLSNRGAGTIVVFDLGGDRVQLSATFSAGGSWPRHFAISNGFAYVAQQHDDLIVAFAIDAESGGLSPLANYATGSPTCIAFEPLGRH